MVRMGDGMLGRVLFFGALALACVSMIGVAVWRDQTHGASDGRRTFAATPVTGARVDARTFADVVEALGDARANESVVITSQSTDIISRVAFKSGDVVTAGQVLVELADAEEAADLNEARATLEEARREEGRISQLIARGVATQAQADQARAAAERARARVASLEAQLANLIIRAPFDGVVGLRNASPGMLVRPADPIATLDDISIIKVDFTVPERFLPQAGVGASLAVRAAAYEDAPFAGVITAVDTRIDPITRAAVVRAQIDNASGRLRPGMLMLVEMRRNERRRPAVPEVALSREGPNAFVYALVSDRGPDGTERLISEKRLVEPGMRVDGFVEILAGLEAGELIAADGVHRLRPRLPVRVVAGEGANSGAPQGGRPDREGGAS